MISGYSKGWGEVWEELYLLSDAFVMTRKLFAIRSRAIRTPISPIDRIPTVANGEVVEVMVTG